MYSKQIDCGAGYRIFTAQCPFCREQNQVWDGTETKQSTQTCAHYQGIYQSGTRFVPVIQFGTRILTNGDIVTMQGTKFRASQVTKNPQPNNFGESVWTFRGEIIDQTDALAQTSYNNAVYTWRPSDNNLEAKFE